MAHNAIILHTNEPHYIVFLSLRWKGDFVEKFWYLHLTRVIAVSALEIQTHFHTKPLVKICTRTYANDFIRTYPSSNYPLKSLNDFSQFVCKLWAFCWWRLVTEGLLVILTLHGGDNRNSKSENKCYGKNVNIYKEWLNEGKIWEWSTYKNTDHSDRTKRVGINLVTILSMWR